MLLVFELLMDYRRPGPTWREGESCATLVRALDSYVLY
jgi:hypothetical protein